MTQEYIGEASGGGGMYYDTDTGMTWTAATGWYYSSGGDESGGAIPGGGGGGGSGGDDPYGVAGLLNGDTGSGAHYIQGVDTDGSITGVPGATYQRNTTSGAISILSRPASGGGGGGTTIIHNTPIQNQAGRYVTAVDTTGGITGYPGATYQQDTYDGSIQIINKGGGGGGGPQESYPGSGVTAQGVSIYAIPSSKSPTGYMLADGRFINPDGSLYAGGGAEKPKTILIDSTGSVTGRKGTSYYYDDNGIPHTLVTGTAPSTSSGGGSGSNAGTFGGSSGSGGGGGSNSTRSGGYTNTNINIQDATPAAIALKSAPTYSNSTSFNTSEMGPGALANAAADRGLSGLQSAGTLSERLAELMDSRTNNIIQNLSNPSDIVAREYTTRGLNAPEGTATPMYGDNAQLSAIIARLMGGQGGGGDFGGGNFGGVPASGGGGAAGGAGAGSPSPTPGSEPAPTTTPTQTPADQWTTAYGPPPEGYGSWQQWLQASGNGPSWLKGMQDKTQGGQGIDWADPTTMTQLGPWIQQYKSSQDPQVQAGLSRYLADQQAEIAFRNRMMNFSYRGDNPATSAIEHDYGTQNFDPTGPTYTASGSAAGTYHPNMAGYQPGYGSDYYPPVTVTTGATGNNNKPEYNTLVDPNSGTGQVKPAIIGPLSQNVESSYAYAHGGHTNASKIIVGDPQADGKPNPELVVTPPGTPKRVIPLRNLARTMPRRMPPISQMARQMQPQMPPPPQDISAPAFAYGTDAYIGQAPSSTDPSTGAAWGVDPYASQTSYDLSRDQYNTNTSTAPQTAPSQPASPEGLSGFFDGINARDLLYSQPPSQPAQPVATGTQPSQPLPNTNVAPAPAEPTGYGDWRDKLPSAGETVPTTTTTASTANGTVAADTGGMGGTNGTGGGPSGEGGGNRAPVEDTGGINAPPPPVGPTVVSVTRDANGVTYTFSDGTITKVPNVSGTPDLPTGTNPGDRFLGPPVRGDSGGLSDYIRPGGTAGDPTGNPLGPAAGAGVGIHPYNGKPADTIMSYPDEAYQNLPALLFAKGLIPLSAFLASRNDTAPGAFGTQIPFAGGMNYTNMLNLMRIPGSYGALSSLAKSANLNLDDEVAKARMRAPLGQAYSTSGIET